MQTSEGCNDERTGTLGTSRAHAFESMPTPGLRRHTSCTGNLARSFKSPGQASPVADSCLPHTQRKQYRNASWSPTNPIALVAECGGASVG